MALNETEAQFLCPSALARGAYEHAAQFNVASLIPVVRVNGYEALVTLVTQGNLSTAAFAGEGQALSENSAVPSSPVSHPFARIASVVGVDRLVDAMYWYPNNQVEFQIKAKIIMTMRKYADAFINGGIVPGAFDFDGIEKRIPAGQTVYAGNGAINGDYMTLDDLVRAFNLVKTVDGSGPDLLLMNKETIREYARVCNDAGMAPELITREECHERIGRFCAAGSAGICEMVCPPVSPAFQGVRICRVDDILLNQTHGSGTNLTSAYFICLGVGRGLAAIEPGKSGNGTVEVLKVPYGFNYDTDGYCVAMNVGLMHFAKTPWSCLGGIITMMMHM